MGHKIYKKKHKGFTLQPFDKRKSPESKYMRKGAGFTLIELLIIIFIVSLISSMLVVNWKKSEKQYQLQRAAQEIVQNIRRTQDRALTGFKYSSSEPPPYNYGVFFEKQSLYSYIIFADKNDNKKYDAPVENIETINIENGIQIDSLSKEPRLHITFSLPDGFTQFEPSDVSATITIKRTDRTCPQYCRSIIIEKTGRVIIQ